MANFKDILNNCSIGDNETSILLPTTIGIEKKHFLKLEFEFTKLSGEWMGVDKFGYKFDTNATIILNTLKEKFND